MKKQVLLIYTGGTIGMVKKYGSEALQPFDFNNILDHIPEIGGMEVSLHYIEFENPMDSSDITPDDWVKLANIIIEKYTKYDGFVVLHGTDTMSYTSSALSFMLQGLQKPIIFTGSQLPIGELRTDSKENLITSIYYASLYKENIPVINEVCLYFEHKLYRANRTTKFSAEHFDAFISPNYPMLGESGVNLGVFPQNLLKPQTKFQANLNIEDKVDIFTFFPGKRKEFLDEMITNPHIKGIILRTFGSGNIPSDTYTLKSIEKAKELGKELVIITQCIRGSVNFGKYQNSLIFNELEVINGYDITVEAATTKLMCLLENNKYSSTQIKHEFERNWVGEIST